MQKQQRRILVGCFGRESGTFTSVKSSVDTFAIKTNSFVSPDLSDFFKQNSCESCETIYITGDPGGIVPKKDYEQLREQALKAITKALPADGILLGMHGSMEVEGIGHGELDFLRHLRQAIGPDIPVALRLDLHGNIPEEFIQYPTALTALRTAPHSDGLQTLERATKQLLRVIEKNLKPIIVRVPIPVVLSGEQVLTDIEPGKSLYQKVQEISERPGILDASLFVGFAWADRSYVCANAIVTAEEDVKLAHQYALELATEYWNARKDFCFGSQTMIPADAVKYTLQSEISPVIISDSGDNITAGGPGNFTALLSELLSEYNKENNLLRVLYAQITDPEATAKCFTAGLHSKITVSVGGQNDIASNNSITLEGTVQSLYKDSHEHCYAVVRCGMVDVILVNDRIPIVPPEHFKEIGVPIPGEYHTIVVKLGYLMPELLGIAKEHILCFSPGYTTLNLEALPYQNLQDPIYPLSGEFEWEPVVEMNKA